MVGVLLDPVTTAYACTCSFDATPAELYAAADAVVRARVLDVDPRRLAAAWCEIKSALGWHVSSTYFERCGVRVTLSVIRQWKGGLRRELRLVTGRGGRGDCGVPFEVDQEYLLYLAAEDKDRYYSATICTTRAIQWAQADLSFLGAGAIPQE